LLIIVPINGYTLDYWVSYTKGEIYETPWLIKAGISLFIGWNIGIVAALVTWAFDTADIPADHPYHKTKG